MQFEFKAALLKAPLALTRVILNEDKTNPAPLMVYVTQLDASGKVESTGAIAPDQLANTLAGRTVLLYDATREMPALLKVLKDEIRVSAMLDITNLYHMAQLVYYKEIRLIDMFRDLAYAEVDFYRSTILPFSKAQEYPEEAQESILLASLADNLIATVLKRRYLEASIPEHLALQTVERNVQTQMDASLYLYECNANGFLIDVAEMEDATQQMALNLAEDENSIRNMIRAATGWNETPSLLDAL